ncbi:MAG TPA: methyltransferase domain-containing protein [Pseudonocardia sp.]|uniref:methyltransferase domain-containing protein n=1 Tax=Pseudonocardia sp. TaxID=60912 RepID=UPI002B5ACF13|nr:methyltransferase domain-containing protein [Pseudonocardia sp.]HTF47118.1 methyltransferase domain-containing protein [Pseudonocardia sp.]
MGYTLKLSAGELGRYRLMAEYARDTESTDWAAAGISSGARVADVGCGPGAMLRVLAEIVGPAGAAHGVDQDLDAVAAATGAVAGLGHASAQPGAAAATGLEQGSYDAVMCRHVLGHNGGAELEIVSHLAELSRPGGAVVLVDVDGTATRMHPDDPDLADLTDRYLAFHRARGNHLLAGMQLGWLLEQAGLAVEVFRHIGPLMRIPPGLRPAGWAARDALVVAGFADAADLLRWERAFDRLDRAQPRPWGHVAGFLAIGRRPAP